MIHKIINKCLNKQNKCTHYKKDSGKIIKIINNNFYTFLFYFLWFLFIFCFHLFILYICYLIFFLIYFFLFNLFSFNLSRVSSLSPLGIFLLTPAYICFFILDSLSALRCYYNEHLGRRQLFLSFFVFPFVFFLFFIRFFKFFIELFAVARDLLICSHFTAAVVAVAVVVGQLRINFLSLMAVSWVRFDGERFRQG